jgi:DNA-binding SARP family transcriptional activator/DNA-binding XRE family transcriptional regulator
VPRATTRQDPQGEPGRLVNADSRHPVSSDAPLSEFRRCAGLSQQGLADRAGMSVGALRDLEQGRVTTPRPDTLCRLAAALSLSTSEVAELVRLGRRKHPPEDELRVRVLGPLRVVVGGTALDLRSTKQRALLGMLALAPNHPVGLDTLLEMIWEGKPPATAADLVQSHVSRLRRRLRHRRSGREEPELLVATQGGYQLTVTEQQLDLLEFRRLAGEARRAREAGELARAFDRYGHAMRLWRGQPLAELAYLQAHPWVVALGREWQAAVVELAEIATALGRHDAVLPLLRQVTDSDPLHEGAHARLMVALAGSGQQAAALGVFEDLRVRLADELGADPGPEIVNAHRRVLRQDVVPDVGPAIASVRGHRQLPPDIADFTGREAELHELYETVAVGAEGSTATAISVIEGMAGVGKTRLAVHFAHQLVRSGRYADLQLYVDLHGHADEPPADPASVLASFLHLLGVPDALIPDEVDGRAALYRDRLHDRNALVLLDNAATEQQILPLLPAGQTNLVLVTTRRVLAIDGARPLPLDVFAPDEAYELLAKIVGPRRVGSDPVAARQVAELCGRLPLAMTLAARRLQSRPAWKVSDLAVRLRDNEHRLDELAAGTRQVRAVFDLSYQALDPVYQRAFRLLGRHPGDDFTIASAAALTGLEPGMSRGVLDQLADDHLVTQVTPDRYGLHDLLREYAVERCATEDGEDQIRAAVGRLLDWYLHAADAAVSAFSPHIREVVLDEHERPPDPPVFGDDEQAFRWLTAEHATLVAAVTDAFELRMYGIAWRLWAVLRPYFDRRSSWRDWISTNRIAVAAARRAGDLRGEAITLSGLGLAYGQLDMTDQAMECLVRSLSVRRRLGDRSGEARTLNNLGIAEARQGNFRDAIEHFTEALHIRRELGELHAEMSSLNNLGRAYAAVGRYEDAIDCLRWVLRVRKRLGDLSRTGSVLSNLGEALLHAGRAQEAVHHLREALNIHREKHSPGYQAETLEILGRALAAAGRPGDARQCWQEAATLLDELGHPQAGEIGVQLRRDTGPLTPTAARS